MKPGELFSHAGATGVNYCDKAREHKGDYLLVAILLYSTLELKVYAPRNPLLPLIREDAAKLQARRGEQYPWSSTQTITLGHSIEATK